MAKYQVGMRLSYRADVSDYITIDAEDCEDAKAKMYEYLEKRMPHAARDVKVDYATVNQ